MAKKPLPVIGVTLDTNIGKENDTPENGLTPNGVPIYWLKKHYTDAVEHAGGLPLPIPVTTSNATIDAYFGMIDGLVLSGGEFDIDPHLYGEEPMPECGALKPDRTVMEMRLLKKAIKAGMPVLGICGGHQAINVAFGGTLYQDIPAQLAGALKHQQKPIPSHTPSHEVTVAEDTTLGEITGMDKLAVNSTHHQGVKKIGKGLVACAHSSDGLVEAVAYPKARFAIGVQWHPEQLYSTDEASRKLFKKLIAESRDYRDKKLSG